VLHLRSGIIAAGAVLAGALLTGFGGFTTPAFASASHFGGAAGAVFVQTDNTSGNAIVAYQRSADGTLTQAGTYPTRGLGGILAGSVVDHLASQGSLSYDTSHQLLFAVNAGSNTVSVFAVHGDQHRGTWRPGVRAERTERRVGPGLPALR
jgi:hypothetical protein